MKEGFFLDHLPHKEVTIAEVLKARGYSTAYIGKQHLAGEGSIYTTDETVNAEYHPDKQGFDINIGGNTYFAMIEKLDKNVGKVMDKLDELNLLENTVVIFYSDNGGLWENPPLKGIMGTLNEVGIRVPLIVSYPGKIEQGSTCEVPVTTVDFFPTFLDWAGDSPSNYPQLEGESLLPLLYEKADFKDRPIYWLFPHHRKEGLSMGAAIRENDWKLIKEFESEEIYLYNLKDDPREENNLGKEFPEKRDDLLIKLEKWQTMVDGEIING